MEFYEFNLSAAPRIRSGYIGPPLISFLPSVIIDISTFMQIGGLLSLWMLFCLGTITII